MKNILFFLLLFVSCINKSIDKPNILFVSIDDLNDWNEPLSGNNKVFNPFLEANSLDKFRPTKTEIAIRNPYHLKEKGPS